MFCDRGRACARGKKEGEEGARVFGSGVVWAVCAAREKVT